VATFFLGGGTFRWGVTQRRGAWRATTTEPMELYSNA